MTRRTSEGFVILEIDKAGKATLRCWLLHSDIDSRGFIRQMSERFTNYSYILRRANVAEYET